MATMLTIEQIQQLILQKEDAMRQLSFHKNMALAAERWRDYQDELRDLRRLASQMIQ